MAYRKSDSEYTLGERTMGPLPVKLGSEGLLTHVSHYPMFLVPGVAACDDGSPWCSADGDPNRGPTAGHFAVRTDGNIDTNTLDTRL